MSVKRKKKQNLKVIKSRSTQIAAKSIKPTAEPVGVSREIYSLFFGFVSLFLLVAIFHNFKNDGTTNPMGLVGSKISKGFYDFIGISSFFLPLITLAIAHSFWTKKVDESPIIGKRVFLITLGVTVFSFACATISSIVANIHSGGYVGSELAIFFTKYFSSPGAFLISFAIALLSFINTTKISSSYFLRGLSLSINKFIFAIIDILKAFMTFSFSTITKVFVGKNPNNPSRTIEFSENDIENDHAWSIDGAKVKNRKKLKTEPEYVIEDEEDDSEFDDEYDDEEDDEFDDEDYIIEDKKIKVDPLISRTTYVDYLQNKNKNSQSKNSKQVSSEFKLPAADLLVRSDPSLSTSPKDNELLENSKRLEIALENFKITGKIVEVHPGPVVTLYQFEPGAGVKVQRIITLADDLALALKVGSVRVYAPVPGKGTVGIEVPNSQREIVRLREVIEAEEFKSLETPLLLALGKDTYGVPYIADLAKMPHLLIAGATGTGKSVCINSILMSLLYRNTPDQLRLIMIDPKMLELSVYEDIPHLNAPVVTNPKHARAVLWWAVEEMERRYELMKEYGVRNIAMYNRLIEEKAPAKKGNRGAIVELEEKDVIASGSPDEGIARDTGVDSLNFKVKQATEVFPRIVIIVDELADLMLTVGREIEELLTRLAQKARASGIHLILATQRPSVNVITGLIKANFPARISFKVAGKVDARTVMDTSGAEKLLGQGDMLFMSPSVGRVLRLHSPFVSDKEVNDVVDAIRSQGAPRYDQNIEKTIKKLEEKDGSDGISKGNDEYDEYYDQAVQLVVEKGQASTSMVQRAFRIGYNRAARILEVMERDGVVGPADGARPRQVLVSDIN